LLTDLYPGGASACADLAAAEVTFW